MAEEIGGFIPPPAYAWANWWGYCNCLSNAVGPNYGFVLGILIGISLGKSNPVSECLTAEAVLAPGLAVFNWEFGDGLDKTKEFTIRLGNAGSVAY